MRKRILTAAISALTVLTMAAAPAMADDSNHNRWNDWNGWWWNDWNGWWWNDNFDDGLFQDFEQEADSGDVDQSFDVSGAGDNANQSVGISGDANTGNAQNQIGFTQFNSDIDDFEFDDSGADIDVNGSSDVSSNQTINQAASSH